MLIYDINRSFIHRKILRSETYCNSNSAPASFSWPPLLTSDWTDIVNTHKRINLSGLPNFSGLKIPVKSKLNIKNWRSLLNDYKDADICDFLEFGFPVGYTASQLPTPSQINHKGALAFADHVDQFLDKEVSLGAALGPFTANPLCLPLNISS